MHSRLVVVAFVLVALLVALTACTSDDDAMSSATPTASPTSTAPIVPTAAATITPAPPGDEGPRRTGDAAIDSVIDMVERKDWAGLQENATTHMTGPEGPRVPCVDDPGMGWGIRCDPENGEVPGDEVRYFPAMACEGAWRRSPDAVLRAFVDRGPVLYAVVDARGVEPRPTPPHTPPDVGDVWLVYRLTAPGAPPATRMHLTTEGAVVGMSIGCVGTPEELSTDRGRPLPFLIEPEAPNERVQVPSTGVAAIDAVIEDVATYDLAALSENASTFMAGEDGPRVACVEEPQDSMAVPCDPEDGEQPGDLVVYFPVTGCEGGRARDASLHLSYFLSLSPILRYVVDARGEGQRSAFAPPPGAYWLVYERPLTTSVVEGIRLHVNERGEIVALLYGCGETAERLATAEGKLLPVILEVRQEAPR